MMSTAFDEFHENFLRVESDLDLFTLEVDGLNIWERIRHDIAFGLLEELGIIGSTIPDRSSSVKKLVRSSYFGLSNLVYRNPMFASQPEVLCYGRGRRIQLDEGWWDLYLDPLHRATDAETLQIEAAWNGAHATPEMTENLKYIDFVDLCAIFCYRTGLVRHQFSAKEQRAIERLELRLRSEFGVDHDVKSDVQRVVDRRRVEKPLYDALLSRLDPRLAVVVVHGGKETFIESCHDAEIPVVELQHGQISKYSYNYSFSGARTKQMFPDYLLTFGDVWERNADLPLDSDRVISVGYPHLDQKLAQHEDIEPKRNLLFISTSESGPELSKLAAEVSARSDHSFDVVYKLHPVELSDWKQRYPHLVDSAVTVIDNRRESLYELFAKSTAQVGVGSTALYEGFAFGLDTFLIEKPTVEWLSLLLENDSARLVHSVDELIERLGAPLTPKLSRDQVFKPNATENMVMTINELLNTASIRRNH